jgi:hypothetical protein
MVQKEMMVFYVPEEHDSGRMGTPFAYFIGFDGNESYNHKMPETPKTFEAMVEFLKTGTLTLTQSDSTMFFFDVIMQCAKGDDKNIKAITDFKFADLAYLGMGNFGYSLGQLLVNIIEG